jgi:hypothetical protein
VVAGLHIAESGYTETYSTDFSEAANPTPHEKSALQWALFYGDRPIMDTFGSMILHNLFGRFPTLKMLSVENGSLWVPYLLAVMDKMKGMGRSGKWLGGRVEGRPSDIFRRHVTVSPFHEESLSDLLAVLDADNIAIGSDYPHPEASASREYAESLHDLSDETVLHDDLRQLGRDDQRDQGPVGITGSRHRRAVPVPRRVVDVRPGDRRRAAPCCVRGDGKHRRDVGAHHPHHEVADRDERVPGRIRSRPHPMTVSRRVSTRGRGISPRSRGRRSSRSPKPNR